MSESVCYICHSDNDVKIVEVSDTELFTLGKCRKDKTNGKITTSRISISLCSGCRFKMYEVRYGYEKRR